MRAGVVIGVFLIVLGVLALVYQGFTYTTHRRVIDVGPFEATTEHRKSIPLPPVIGGAALAGGIVLLLAGTKKA